MWLALEFLPHSCGGSYAYSLLQNSPKGIRIISVISVLWQSKLVKMKLGVWLRAIVPHAQIIFTWSSSSITSARKSHDDTAIEILDGKKSVSILRLAITWLTCRKSHYSVDPWSSKYTYITHSFCVIIPFSAAKKTWLSPILPNSLA